MNIPEEYVSLYLRLNGFLLLRGFTHLSESGQAKETDILGLRCPGCVEKVNQIPLPIDDNLFSEQIMSRDEVVPVICEVKGSLSEKPEFDDDKVKYLKNFFGSFEQHTLLLGVSQAYDYDEICPITVNVLRRDEIDIGLKYIVERTKWLVEERTHLCNKAGTWSMSEALLQELLRFEMSYNQSRTRQGSRTGTNPSRR